MFSPLQCCIIYIDPHFPSILSVVITSTLFPFTCCTLDIIASLILPLTMSFLRHCYILSIAVALALLCCVPAQEGRVCLHNLPTDSPEHSLGSHYCPIFILAYRAVPFRLLHTRCICQIGPAMRYNRRIRLAASALVLFFTYSDCYFFTFREHPNKNKVHV